MKSSLLKIHKIHSVMLSIKENKFIKKKIFICFNQY